MTKGDYLFLAAVVAFLGFVIFASLQPSCEERGGKRVPDGRRLVLVGKVFVSTDSYRCELAK